MSRQNVLGHAVVYGLGNILLQMAAILLLPLYTRCLSLAEFGLLEVFNRFGELVATCLLFNGVRQAVLVFHGQSAGGAEARGVAGAAVAVAAAGTLLGGLLALSVLAPLGAPLAPGDDVTLLLMVLSMLLEAAGSCVLALAQARLESVFFVGATLLQVLLRVALSILFVAVCGWGVRGVAVAAVLSSAAYFGAALARERAYGPLRLHFAQARAMVRFALPLVPCGLCFFLLNNGDRFVLLRCAGEQEVGLYALGYKLAAAVNLLARGPLMMVWGPRAYQVAARADAPEIFGRTFTHILAAYVFVGLGACLLAGEAVAVLGGPAFAGAAAVIAPVVLAYFFLVAADLMDAGFYVRRRTALKTWVTVPSTVVTLLLYLALIPRWGGAGAAWATLLGFACHALLTGLVSSRIFPVRWEATRVATMLALAVALWAVGRLLPVTAWAVPLRAALWLLWPTFLWTAGVVTGQEKDLVRAGLRWGAARLRAALGWRIAGEIR